mmetsp:Transcript_22841/g.26032  ORF Transcript_22841/g.26032 Transcript_22841/m.26032 type:complete len:303 (-) Transcript_22841:306-1214(-)|eukprot:CAMPEP_0194141738 /NCGR_PEP_ID=MMETSP0152-20130528/11121_1 /TAXON_ID=1049557 /ORGANISM="Thalassiothrix antarctica, Strain L6-D1" /LENGTH=302 /DNA_ID=CAMNT_0038840461 /DNA_START=156 /DNA_END=1064 /DNA_ORIENTATION=+
MYENTTRYHWYYKSIYNLEEEEKPKYYKSYRYDKSSSSSSRNSLLDKENINDEFFREVNRTKASFIAYRYVLGTQHASLKNTEDGYENEVIRRERRKSDSDILLAAVAVPSRKEYRENMVRNMIERKAKLCREAVAIASTIQIVRQFLLQSKNNNPPSPKRNNGNSSSSNDSVSSSFEHKIPPRKQQENKLNSPQNNTSGISERQQQSHHNRNNKIEHQKEEGFSDLETTKEPNLHNDITTSEQQHKLVLREVVASYRNYQHKRSKMVHVKDSNTFQDAKSQLHSELLQKIKEMNEKSLEII